MAINKIVFGDSTLMDISDTDAQASDVAVGKVFYAANGVQTVGTASYRDGYTFYPAVSSEGIISWTNDGDLPNPDPVNIKGPQGEDGAIGPTGPTGKRGGDFLGITTAPSTYTTTTGGFTPSYRILLSTVKTQSGASVVLAGDVLVYSYYLYPVGYVDASYVYCGARKSIRGATGAAAGFGTSTASVDANVGTPSVTITSSGSATSKIFDFAFHNLKGETGATGSTGPTGPAGPGVPAGGTAGQILKKSSSTDYATEWDDATGGIYVSDTAPTDSQINVWIDTDESSTGGILPAGGTAGQMLVKNSANNYDAGWAAIPGWTYVGTATGTNTVSLPNTAWTEVFVKGYFGLNGTVVISNTVPRIALEDTNGSMYLHGSYRATNDCHVASIYIKTTTVGLGTWVYNGSDVTASSAVKVWVKE